MSYFEQLQQDWDMLSFDHDGPKRAVGGTAPSKTKTYEDLRILMINMSLNVESSHKGESENTTNVLHRDLNTDLGRHLLDLCRLQSFDRHIDRWMCGAAEPRIATSLDPENIRNEKFPSPIIVVKDDIAIGAIKRFGLRSYYALRDDEATGTYAGHAYETPFTHQPFTHIAKSPNAAYVPMSSIDEYLGNTRMTYFKVPPVARKGIEMPRHVKYDQALVTAHEDLVTFADEALLTAEPTELVARYELVGAQ